MAGPPRRSAGIALVRRRAGHWELLLVHPGGPYWRSKDTHGWSIPKGELDGEPTTDPPPLAVLEDTARREFAEETGAAPPGRGLTALPELNLGSGKRLVAFLAEGDLDPSKVVSNTFEMEWPPRSGRRAAFPEVDRAGWFDLETAGTKLHKGQVALIDRLMAALDISSTSD
jgi:predicted NUDIX family NTP pyrophosphohydrolase